MECDKDPQKIQKMFDEISSYYDKMNNFISLGTHFLIKYIALRDLGVFKGANILDLCCGTGDFTKIISKICPEARVLGLDFSKNMLKSAMQKNPKKAFVYADCTNLPFKDNEFDFVTEGFGLRNIKNRKAAISEAYRVLKPNGRFLHLDFGTHNKISSIFSFAVPVIVKIFKKNAAHYNYLLASKDTFPEPDKLIEEFENAGFKLLKRHDFLFGAISAQIMTKTK